MGEAFRSLNPASKPLGRFFDRRYIAGSIGAVMFLNPQVHWWEAYRPWS